MHCSIIIRRLIFIVPFVFSNPLFSQGHIDHIKNQAYLKEAKKVNCNSLDGDNLSIRICTNLAFQKSDSLLTVVYNELLGTAKGYGKSTLRKRIIDLQRNWRGFRNEHCTIIYDQYGGCGGCHAQAIAYMTCLKELTDNRIAELKKLNQALK